MSIFPSLFFTVDIAHAHDLSEVLRSNGVNVWPVSGKTSDEEEQRLYRLFREGAIDGLASCGVLQEGFDEPRAMGAFLCRPTKSSLLYRQMCGRVTRPFPAPTGKRPYQRDCMLSILEDVKAGTNLQLVVMATGLGKTICMTQIPWVVRQWKGRQCKRIIFIVHRDNLVQQAAAQFSKWQPNLKIGIEAGGGRYANDADVVIASMQTVGRATADRDGDGDVAWEYTDRISKFNPDDFDAVIVDEAHHVGKGRYYHNALRWFHVLKGEPDLDPQKLLVGITATPERTDNIGLEVCFDKIVFEYGLRDGVKQGFLADLKAYRIETHTDISDVKTTAGDLNLGQLEAAVNTPERNSIVAREYLRIRDIVKPDAESNIGRKPYCVICDFVDVSGRHQLIGAASLFGLREKFDLQGRSAIETAEEMERLEAENLGLDLQGDNLDEVKKRVEKIKTSLRSLSLLDPPQMPPELQRVTKLVWLKEGPGSYRLGCMDGTMLSVRENTLGGMEVYRHNKGVRTLLLTANTLTEAVRMAEHEIPEKDRKVMRMDSAWRNEPPTEKQIRFLFTMDRKMKSEFPGPDAMFQFCMNQFNAGQLNFSRGEISKRIDAVRGARG